MRDWLLYRITVADGYCTADTDAALERIAYDVNHNDDIDLGCEICSCEDGVLEIEGEIWHEEINEFLVEITPDYDLADIPLVVRSIDYDAYYEDAPHCSFILHGHAWYEDVRVETIWPEWSEDLRWKAE